MAGTLKPEETADTGLGKALVDFSKQGIKVAHLDFGSHTLGYDFAQIPERKL
jgi:hypothetical protein